MFTPDQAKGLSMVFLQSLGNEVPTTRRGLAAVPEAQLDFKLGEKGRTTRELMWHIVHSEKWFGEGVAAGSFQGGGADGTAPATAFTIAPGAGTGVRGVTVSMPSGDSNPASFRITPRRQKG